MDHTQLKAFITTTDNLHTLKINIFKEFKSLSKNEKFQIFKIFEIFNFDKHYSGQKHLVNIAFSIRAYIN